MRRPSLLFGALLGGVGSLALIGLFYLGHQVARLPNVPLNFFDWLVRIVPGHIVSLAIDSMVRFILTLRLGEISETAKLLERLMAFGLAVAIGALLGVVVAWILRRRLAGGWQAGLIGGTAIFLTATGLEFSRGLTSNATLSVFWMALLFIGGGMLLGKGLEAGTPVAGVGYHADRRAAIVKIGLGSIGVALAAWGMGRLLEPRRETGANEPFSSGAPAPTRVATTVEPAPGTRPELTANDDFYRIDIDIDPPIISGPAWVLAVEGLFAFPRQLNLADLMGYPAVTQPITLCCISNPIGGDLNGTSYWTGVRMVDLMKDLGLRPEAKWLYIAAADGFFESVALADLADPRTLLVYGMNGVTLPVEHGFPLRIYIPDRYGMKQPKWITRLYATDLDLPGYWVQRGWSKEARAQTMSIIDTVATSFPEAGRVPIGGMAWAGARGIQKVEVQVDNEDWEEATLLTPPLGPLTWVLWRYDWPLQRGLHTFTVRATDGTGKLQIGERGDPYAGETGYHTVTRVI